MNAHFPVSNSMQQFIVIHSDTQDLRSPRALADMEQMAARVAQLPNIAAVRGITRPNGEMLTEARATHQPVRSARRWKRPPISSRRTTAT